MSRRTGTLVLVAVLAALVAPVTAPVSVTYVHSGSMEPTIGEGDGFVLVPAGHVEPGDVVTFYSEYRGEYVTHRVVDTTDRGFVTRGDANPTTDQAAGHPPVSRDAVVGRVATVGGALLVVPGLGTLALAVTSARELLVAATLLVAALFARRSGGRPDRPVTTSRELFRSLLTAAVVTSVALIMLGGVTVAVPVADSAADAGPRDLVLAPGTEATVEFTVSGSPLLARTVTADGASVTDVDAAGDTLALSLAPPPDGAGDAVRVSFYRYPPVLPGPVLAALQRVHPLLAASASVLLTFLPVSAATHLLFGGEEPLRPPRVSRRWGDGP